MPTVELVDLPGLQNLPPEAAAKSREVVQRFMKKDDPETLVLCVIPADSSSLDSSDALRMVTDYGHAPSTIVALTKADKVDLNDPDDIKNQLFLPLLRDLKTPELECIHSMGGCVAVSNRKHQNTVSLFQQREIEAALFDKILATATGEFATDDVKQKLSQNMGSTQLILQLAAMYRKHIVTVWVPKAIEDAKGLRDQTRTALGKLGRPPHDIAIEEVLADIQTKVLFSATSVSHAHRLNCMNVGKLAWVYISAIQSCSGLQPVLATPCASTFSTSCLVQS